MKHEDCEVTQFGSSAQISESLVQRIKLLTNKKDDLTDQDWETYKQKRIKTYQQEVQAKMIHAVSLKQLKISKAKERLAAKVSM